MRRARAPPHTSSTLTTARVVLRAQALLGFVNFKLYHALELSYPPTLDRCALFVCPACQLV